ncbi:MAG TPA: DUF1804 family protein [Spirochaetota bacterium]|nr:DUF1804 family protein [Spirochaetota bacterium]
MKYSEIGVRCEDLFIKQDKVLSEISTETGVSVTTLSRWKNKYDWDKKREEYRISNEGLVYDLKKAIADMKAMLKSAIETKDPKVISVVADAMSKIERIIKNADGLLDAESAATIVMDEFTKFVTSRTDINKEFSEKLLKIIYEFLDRIKND